MGTSTAYAATRSTSSRTGHAIYEFADRLARAYGDYANLNLDCGEEADPDAEEQDFAFMLPSDQRVPKPATIGVGP